MGEERVKKTDAVPALCFRLLCGRVRLEYDSPHAGRLGVAIHILAECGSLFFCTCPAKDTNSEVTHAKSSEGNSTVRTPGWRILDGKSGALAQIASEEHGRRDRRRGCRRPHRRDRRTCASA